MADSSH